MQKCSPVRPVGKHMINKEIEELHPKGCGSNKKAPSGAFDIKL